jgi:hypothetical protein
MVSRKKIICLVNAMKLPCNLTITKQGKIIQPPLPSFIIFVVHALICKYASFHGLFSPYISYANQIVIAYVFMFVFYVILSGGAENSKCITAFIMTTCEELVK